MNIRKFLKPDKQKVSIMLYIVLTVVLCYLAIQLLGFSSEIINKIGGFFKTAYAWITPALIGIVIAYLLYPLVMFIFGKLSKLPFIKDSIAKFISIVLAYLFIIGIIVGFFYALYISIGGQLSQNTNFEQIIQFTTQFMNNESIPKTAEKITALFRESGFHLSDQIYLKIAEVVFTLREYVYSFISGVGSAVLNIGESLVSVGLGIILSIYLIKDANYFLTLGRRVYYIILGETKLKYRLLLIFNVFNRTFKRYIKGQLIEAFFVAVLSTSLLAVLGIKYSLLIGIVSGVTNMIPYVGPLVGTILAGFMGLLDGSLSAALIGMITMQVVQQIDNNILAPKIVGGMVGLHPVFIILSLIIGGKFGGVLGMVLAVPIAASCKILFNTWYQATGKNEDWTIFKTNIDKEYEIINQEINDEFAHRKDKKRKSQTTVDKIVNNIFSPKDKSRAKSNKNDIKSAKTKEKTDKKETENVEVGNFDKNITNKDETLD